MPRLLVVNGPTASGKTAFAIALAQHFQTEIISCDSRQFYREIPIGTAQPSDEELAAVPHHFIASHSIHENLSAGEFERLALAKLDTLFAKHENVVLVGGSGMYEKAVCEGLDDLPHNADVRDQLMTELKEAGIAPLQAELKLRDPVFHAQIDLQNPQRLVRALEVCRVSNRPYSELRKTSAKVRPFDIVKFGMDLPREMLYERINKRVHVMMKAGLLAEVKKVNEHRDLNALKTVGYRELFDHLDGNTTLDEAVSAIQQNTRRFAKRQMTWYRRDDSIKWVDPNRALEEASTL